MMVMNMQIMENMHYKSVRELERPTTCMHNDKLSTVIMLDSTKQVPQQINIKIKRVQRESTGSDRPTFASSSLREWRRKRPLVS